MHICGHWPQAVTHCLYDVVLMMMLMMMLTVSGEKACPGFSCGGGGCVSSASLCDGSPDCPDGSDESQHNCGKKKNQRLRPPKDTTLTVASWMEGSS